MKLEGNLYVRAILEKFDPQAEIGSDKNFDLRRFRPVTNPLL